jgi:hypothetical protein
MQKKVFLIIVALLTVSSVGLGQSSDKYSYLVNATNQMSATVGQSAAPDRAALLNVTTQACNALSTLLEDKQFHQDLSRLNDQVPASRQERAQLKRDLDLFVLSFLRIEERSLRDAGLEESAAKEILWSASMFRSSIDVAAKPEYVLGTIAKLRSDVCNGSRKLQSEEDSAKRWAMVRKWSFRIGGVTLIAVDVGGAAIAAGTTAGTTAPIIAPIAAGSAAIGAAVAGWTE